MYSELLDWFQNKNIEGINYHLTLLSALEYVRGRIKEYGEEKKHRQQLKQQIKNIHVDTYKVLILKYKTGNNKKNYKLLEKKS